MAATIDWNVLVGNKTIDNGGLVGDLLKLTLAHVSEEVRTGRLPQKEAGQVYTATIASSIQSAMKYMLDEQLVEAQIDKASADAEVAKATAEREYVQTLATIGKVYGYRFTLDAEGNIDRSTLVDNGDGQLDYEAELSHEKVLSSEYERTNILPEQLIKLQEEIDLLQSKDVEEIASTARKDEQLKLSKIPSTLR